MTGGRGAINLCCTITTDRGGALHKKAHNAGPGYMQKNSPGRQTPRAIAGRGRGDLYRGAAAKRRQRRTQTAGVFKRGIKPEEIHGSRGGQMKDEYTRKPQGKRRGVCSISQWNRGPFSMGVYPAFNERMNNQKIPCVTGGF